MNPNSPIVTRQTKAIDAESLGISETNLAQIRTASFQDLKIVRIQAKQGQESANTKLHDNCACLEMVYVLSGSLKTRIEKQESILEANDIIMFDGTLDHEHTSLTEADYLVMHLPRNSTLVESLLKASTDIMD